MLTEDFFSVEEPEISYDATKILFAGKKTAEAAWEVWDMTPLRLRPGSNNLVIKVHDEWGPWLLRARITDTPHRMSKAAALGAG